MHLEGCRHEGGELMDLIEIHRFVVQTRFPAHRVKELTHSREPAPIYTMGNPPSEEQVKKRSKIEFLLMALTKNEWKSIDQLRIGRRISFLHEGYMITGEINSVSYICGTVHHVKLIDARRERAG